MSELDGLEHMFGESEAVTETPAPEPQKQPEAEPAKEPVAPAEQPRDESGRFAPKAGTPEAQPAPAAPAEAAPPVQPQQQKPLVDADQFKGYLEEREKRQKLEAEIKALREQQQQRAAQQQSPNFAEDPEGYIEFQRQQFARSQFTAHFNTCQRFATKEYGADTVQAALEWGQSKVDDPRGGVHFAGVYANQEDPVDWIVKQYKRDQILSQIGDKDPLEWAKELLASRGDAQPNTQAQQSAPPQPASPQQSTPSPSLASARSAGGVQSIPLGGEAAFEAMFQK